MNFVGRPAILVVALALAGCGPAEEDAPKPYANRTRAAEPMAPDQYVARASAADLYAIESARLAIERARNAETRGLAQMILAGHQRLQRELAAAAAEAQPALAPVTSLNAEQQAELAALRALPRARFDAEWLGRQVRAHQQAFDHAAQFARFGEPAPLRRHAAATIAPIQTHLIRARRLEAEALAR